MNAQELPSVDTVPVSVGQHVSIFAVHDRDTQCVDYKILKYLQNHRTPARNRFWLTVSNSFVLSPAPLLGMFVGGLCADDRNSSETLYSNAGESAVSVLLNSGLTMGAKSLVRRPRPWVAYDGDLVCLQTVRSTSFPSGHTSLTFAAATSLSLAYPEWYVVIPSYLWAGAVGFSRMYIGAHYPSDVLAGALLGAGSALLVHYVWNQLWKRNETPIAPQKGVVIPFVFVF